MGGRRDASHCMFVRNSCKRGVLVLGIAWAIVSQFLLGNSAGKPCQIAPLGAPAFRAAKAHLEGIEKCF
jgi:hypothetical protein